MRPSPLEQWHAMVRAHDASGLDAMLADDAVFISPVVHAAQRGKALAKAYLGAAFKVFFNPGFRYIREIVGPTDAMLEFETEKESSMVRSVVLCLAAASLLACATSPSQAPWSPPGHQAGEEGAVLAAFDRYLQALSNRDVQAMVAMQTPEGMTYVSRPREGGGSEIVARPTSHFTDPARAEGPALRERYWSPTVLVRGDIAVVWAPYEFWLRGETSHCGVDVFDFVNIEGEWRVSNAMWTVEPGTCDELRPADKAALRPAG